MSRDELIEALVRFTEQTGVEWVSMYDHSHCPGEFTVRFINVEEEGDDDA